MLETHNRLKKQENKEVVREQRKELKFQKSERKISGHKLFEYSETIKKLELAKFVQIDNIIDFTKPDPAKDFLSRLKILTKPNCIYIQALNKDNAIKRLKRDYQIIYTS